jgi:hypothetical protein
MRFLFVVALVLAGCVPASRGQFRDGARDVAACAKSTLNSAEKDWPYPGAPPTADVCDAMMTRLVVLTPRTAEEMAIHIELSRLAESVNRATWRTNWELDEAVVSQTTHKRYVDEAGKRLARVVMLLGILSE